jgi:hypothetical protein
MATSPPGSQLTFQLSDRALTPILSSSKPASQKRLATTAISSYDYASRLGLGLPKRLIIETNTGPIILYSYLTPTPLERQRRHQVGTVEQTRRSMRSLEDNSEEHMQRAEAANESDEAVRNSVAEPHLEESDELLSETTTQLFVSVIAPNATYFAEARKVAARLERVGLQMQREASRLHTEQQQVVLSGDEDD